MNRRRRRPKKKRFWDVNWGLWGVNPVWSIIADAESMIGCIVDSMQRWCKLHRWYMHRWLDESMADTRWSWVHRRWYTTSMIGCINDDTHRWLGCTDDDAHPSCIHHTATIEHPNHRCVPSLTRPILDDVYHHRCIHDYLISAIDASNHRCIQHSGISSKLQRVFHRKIAIIVFFLYYTFYTGIFVYTGIFHTPRFPWEAFLC